MKKLCMLLIFVLSMAMASHHALAQEVTITLNPGWNWISYPNSEAMSVATAFGDFVPMDGDIVKSRFGSSTYNNGRWKGGVTYFIPGWGYMYYSSRTEDVELVFSQPSSNVVATATPTDITATSAMVGGMVTLPESGHVFLRGVCWGTDPNPDIDGSHSSEETGVGVFTRMLEDLTPGTTYYVRAYAVTDYGLDYGEEMSFTTLEGGSSSTYEYVDLGLPSGLLWATCNVGAETPEDYGDRFAWGETQPKDSYYWGNYQHSNGGDHNLIKYCTSSNYGYNGFTDYLITLLPEDDAAAINWGEDWRMPTKTEWQELYDNTTHTWITQNDVDGFLITASNGNSIFLPVNEYESDYWSSSLLVNDPNFACEFTFDDGSAIGYFDEGNRAYGYPVRAVRCKNSVINVSSNSTAYGSVSGGGTYFDGTNCTVSATANDGYTFIGWSEDGEMVSVEATYSFTVSGNRNLVAYFFNYVSGAYQYVDLGLPSGLQWATCNVGAETPEGYGNYFAWGETQPKGTYNWNTYQYCNGSYNTLTKYCNNSSYGYNGFTDHLTTLVSEDDAATANWGADWRMPTDTEWQELYDNTTYTNATLNGVKGKLFTGSNGNGLFLPVAGYRDGNYLQDASSQGRYWSNSLNNFPNSARGVHFTWSYYNWDWGYFKMSSNGRYFDTSSDNRYYGQSVRAVHSPAQNTPFAINATANPIEGGEVRGVGIYQEGDICTLAAMANYGYTFINWTENGEVVSTDDLYSFTVTGDRNLVANFTQNGSGGEHAYVDLGLPSGLLWATCNVGANAPEDYGDYFAWGETQPKDVYAWSTYQYCNGSSSTLTKYCTNSSYGYNGFTDNLTIIEPSDDAAKANWGNNWRMPTKEEWQELYNNTTVTWTTQNDVYGRLFTSSNGNSLFLPAAGYRDESSLNGTGSHGYYWSSSLNLGSPYLANFFHFNYGVISNDRNDGCSVRPVCSPSQTVPTGAIDGKFTINADGDQVYFSQGNLQYIGSASTPYWKFADNQWDYLSSAQNGSSQYRDRDLFCWGTSGYNHGANCYQPWSVSTNSSDYYAYGNFSYNLYDQTRKADWGYNAISNGGNQENSGWRTPSHAEWAYVFKTRSTTSGIRYAKANVNNVNGVILLPDDWSTDYYSLNSTNTSGASYNSNTITAEQWSTLEQYGAVFLPAAFYSWEGHVYASDSIGFYWSASVDGWRVGFSNTSLDTDNTSIRCSGRSVRLVRNVE